MGAKTAQQRDTGVGITSKLPSRGLRPTRHPTRRGSSCIGVEHSYNEFSASARSRIARVRFDLRQCFCADAATFSTARNAGSSETGAARSNVAAVDTAASDNSASKSNDCATHYSTGRNAVGRGECSASD